MASDAIVLTLPPDPSPELLDRLKAAFPDATLANGTPAVPVPTPLGLETALSGAVAGAAGIGAALSDWWTQLPGGGASLLLMGIALTIAYGVERGMRMVAARSAPDRPISGTYTQRLKNGLAWLLGRLLSLAVFVVAARLIGRAILPAEPGLRDLGLGVLGAILLGRIVIALIEALTAPKDPYRRLMGFGDGMAARILRLGTIIAVIAVVVRLLRTILLDAGGTGPDVQLVLVFLVVANAVASAVFFVGVRVPVASLMTPGADGAATFGWVRQNWHWAFLMLILIDAALKILGVLGLLGPDGKDGAGPVILLILVAALMVAGLATVRREPDIVARGGLVQGGLVLAEGLVMIGTSILLLLFWGIDPLSPHGAGGFAALLPRLVEAAIIVVIGIAFWRTIVAMISSRTDPDDTADDGGDGMGGEGSRLETVLPIVRGFALTLIAVTTAMSALAAVGMNIGPLIASAGVVGLAIGFGAQKLVSDVISGLFYLYEDAFRLGEYIVTEGGKGTVERISIRSARLRHHKGPIYTIPFSAMGTIQNHSRDYVVMKFSFAVPDDTDVEMVRKLVKKAGQELAADPELEGKLIAPLKSQGAISIQGRSFVIGCKFTARPGEQFIIRRKAYVVLQRALKEKGVELFTPALTLSTDGLLSDPAVGREASTPA